MRWRNDDAITLRDAGKTAWRWRYVAAWFVVFWIWLKLVEWWIIIRRVPTWTDSDWQVADQPAPSPAAE